VYPVASRSQDVPTFVHSKVMIVDDRLVRIGSANLSRRSMGVDTECDVAVDAAAAPQARHGVQRICHRMLGEHLGMSADQVASEVARIGTLRGVVDAHAGGDRTLVRVDVPADPPPPAEVVQAAADPDEPIQFAATMAVWIPPLDAGAGRGIVRLWLPAVIIIAILAWLLPALGLPGLPRLQTMLEAGASQSGPWIVLGAFLIAHAALVPLELLAVAAGLTLGFTPGVVVALFVSWIGAAVGYVAGRAITAASLSRWMTRRSYRSIRQLGARGVVGVAILRLASIASAGAVHLVCGAVGVPVATYAAGSLLGLTPIVVGLSTVGALLRSAILQPSWASWSMVGAVVLVLVGLASVLRTVLLLRQFSPTVSRQRQRAEYG
jgi:uncharacterized membrane protein YdjX (TVP38/TMEM64 family)